MYYVYCIGKDTSNIENCYIGVTKNLKKRWEVHKKSCYKVGNHIRKNNLTFSENMVVLFSGTEKECFEKEKSLRPLPQMGLNIAEGGYGGYTKYSKERNLAISKKLKGRSKSEAHKKALQESKKGAHGGEKNPNARLWKFTDPYGKEYIVEGGFQNFCKEKKILHTTLRKHENEKVPPIKSGAFGGFRSINETQRQKRENTVGWMVQVI